MSTISPAKLAANQANAQKSTGPKSAEGKARVAQNAITHGLFAKAIVLEGRDESDEAFQSLLEDLNTQFQPQTPLESLMVQRVATAAWRIQRAHRFESRVLACAHKKSQTTFDQIAQLRARLDQTTAEITECESLLTALDARPPKSADDAAKNAYRALQDRAAEFMNKDYEDSERKFIADDLETHMENRQRLQKRLFKKLNQLEQAVAVDPYCTDPESLIPGPDHLPLLLRYENSLDRQLHRALAALQQSQRRAANFSSRDPASPLAKGGLRGVGHEGEASTEPQSEPGARVTGGTPRPSYPQTPLGNFVTRVPSIPRVPTIDELPETPPDHFRRQGPHGSALTTPRSPQQTTKQTQPRPSHVRTLPTASTTPPPIANPEAKLRSRRAERHLAIGNRQSEIGHWKSAIPQPAATDSAFSNLKSQIPSSELRISELRTRPQTRQNKPNPALHTFAPFSLRRPPRPVWQLAIGNRQSLSTPGRVPAKNQFRRAGGPTPSQLSNLKSIRPLFVPLVTRRGRRLLAFVPHIERALLLPAPSIRDYKSALAKRNHFRLGMNQINHDLKTVRRGLANRPSYQAHRCLFGLINPSCSCVPVARRVAFAIKLQSQNTRDSVSAQRVMKA